KSGRDHGQNGLSGHGPEGKRRSDVTGARAAPDIRTMRRKSRASRCASISDLKTKKIIVALSPGRCVPPGRFLPREDVSCPAPMAGLALDAGWPAVCAPCRP